MALPRLEAIDLIVDLDVRVDFRVVHGDTVATTACTDAERVDQPVAGQHSPLREIADNILWPLTTPPLGRAVEDEVL